MSASSIKLSVACLLLLGVALILVSEGVEAIEPEWSYETGGTVEAVAVSADGEYIVAGSFDDKVYLFDKDSNTPLWSYTTGDRVISVAISADGEYIVAGGYDDKVYLFDKDSSTPLWSYSTGFNVQSVTISADGEYVIAGSWDDKVYLFDKDSSTPLWSYGTGGGVWSVSISADGEYVIAGSWDDKVYLFDKDSSTPLWSYTTDGDVFSVAISADGEYIAAGSHDDNVYTFHKDSSTPLWNYTTGVGEVHTVSISADGEYIVAGSEVYDKKVHLFDKDSGTPLWSYTTGNTVQTVAISANGEYIAAGSWDDNVYFFDKDSSTPLWSYTTGNTVQTVAVSADGKYIAAGSLDDKVYTFKNNLTSRPSLLAYGPRSGSESTTTPQLGWFAGSDDRSNLTFDVYLDTASDPATKVADDITTFYYNTQCLSLNTKYYWKVVATDGDGSVTSSIMNFTATSYGDIFCVSIDDDYDPAELTIIKGSTVIWTNDDSSLHSVTEDDGDFDSGSISPGNTWSYTFDTVGTFDYYDQYDDYDGQIIVLTSYPPVASIDSISPQIAELDSSVSFSGSGSDDDGTISEYSWTSSLDGSLSTSASFSITSLSFGNHTITFRVKDNDGVWSDNVTSWVDVRKTPEWNYTIGHYPLSLAISADGEYIAVGSFGNNVYLFDKDSSTPLWSYAAGDYVDSVAISADGEYIAAGSTRNDDKVYLFDKDSSTPLWSYAATSGVSTVSISADGEYIAVGSEDHKVYLFDKDSSTPLWSYTTGSYVQSVSISADGEYIAAGSDDDKVYLFDKDSSTPLWSYTTDGDVYSVAISADGEYIAAGSQDDKVYLFHKDSSTPLWSYTAGNNVFRVTISADGEYIAAGSDKVYLFDRKSSTPLWNYTPTEGGASSVTISADGEYIVAGSSADKVYLFDKSSSEPLWSCTIGDDVWPVAISADGEYIVTGSQDDKRVYTFQHDSVSRPSVISYGPRSNSTTLNDTTLRWFPGSDDIANLTFDVYMSFIYNDVANNNSAARIADDITNYTHLVTGLNEGKKYYWKVVATDPSGSATSRIMNFTVRDSTAPVTDITSGPPDPSDYRNATFYFEADEDDVDFKCKMDTGSWSYCSSPKTYTDLSRGTYHQFKVKATDPLGNEGDPDSWIWEILGNDVPELTDYNVSPNPAELGQRVYFYSNFSDSDGYIADYSWISDSDGLLSSSGNFSTDDLSTGSHSIKLRAKDNDGDWSDNTTFVLNIGEEEETELPWNYTTGDVVYSVAISADGEYIVAGSNDAKVYLFDKDSSTPLWSYETGGNVNSLSISADGEYIVAGSSDYKVYLFDKDSSTPLWNYTTGLVYSVAISADGHYVIASTGNYRVYLFHKDSSTPLWNYTTGDIVRSVAVSADGEYIAVGSQDNNVYLFDKDSNTPLWSYNANYDVWSVSISSDGEHITAGSYDKVYLFDKDSSTPLWNYNTGSGVTSTSISSDGKYIVASTVDAKVYLFDKDSSTPLWNYTTGDYVLWVAISSDGEYIAASSQDNNVYLFDKDSNMPIWSYETGAARSVSISSDGEYLTAGSYNTKVYAFKNTALGIDPPVVWNVNVSPNPADYNERVYFSANYSDSDGNVTAFEWSSDIDGILNTSGSFDSDNLSAGYHNISFRVKDDDGVWSDYIGIELIIGEPIIEEPNTKPIIYNVSINPNPAYSNERVYFSADYSDSDGNVTAFEWSSDIDGFLINSDNFSADNLSVGHHNISFRVMDDDEAWSDYVYQVLVIEEQEEEPVPEDTSNVTSNYYFSPLEEFELTTSYEDLSATQNYSISVQAQYEQYPSFRANRSPVSVGAWSLGPFDSDATIGIEFAEMWWEVEGDDYSPDCEWTFYIYHNGGLVNDTVVSCGSDGRDLVREVYNISTSLEVNAGDMVDINIWYEGWENVEIFYGSQSVPTGFYISGLEVEDECSFDTFVNNIYVQSPSLTGPVIDEYMLLEVGKGSYHFVSEDNAYISWETTDLSGIKLDNGQSLPSKKLFTETAFDYENRIFTGRIDFTLDGGTYGGAASWDYQMIFSEDYTSIVGGQIYRFDSDGKIFYTWTFGVDGNYPYCALCTLTAADYYSENPFEDTSPGNQTFSPDGDSSDDGGLTLPFSGNPLAYGAIISIIGLLGGGYAAMSARRSIPGLISELQGLADAGISDPELNSALKDLENMDGLGFFSNDRVNAMRILDNYNEMTDQALGSMRQLDELQGVVDELQAAGVSSPELEAEIAEIESMLNSQVEGDTNEDFTANLFESFKKNKGGS